jgi:hypothetical protein
MQLFAEASHALGAILLQIAVGLLFEELMFAGLVRLILAPRPGAGDHKGRNDQGENQCSH